jgi:hypothetical protein
MQIDRSDAITRPSRGALANAQTHIKVRLADGGVALERCEDPGCRVDVEGHATCGRLACPACGCGGANLSAAQEHDLLHSEPVGCSCGHLWMPAR